MTDGLHLPATVMPAMLFVFIRLSQRRRDRTDHHQLRQTDHRNAEERIHAIPFPSIGNPGLLRQANFDSPRPLVGLLRYVGGKKEGQQPGLKTMQADGKVSCGNAMQTGILRDHNQSIGQAIGGMSGRGRELPKSDSMNFYDGKLTDPISTRREDRC